MYKPWLYRYSKFVALITLLLITAGGLVTSTGSGLSVPDWPLSYGKFFPPMIGGIRFEHSHRVIAGFVGILALTLMILILAKEKDKLVRLFGVLAFFTVILQALLGGLTVIYLLPTWISAFHACLGQIFFCLVTAIVFFTSKSWTQDKEINSNDAGSIHRLLAVTTLFIFIQLIIGSIIRHSERASLRLHFILALLITMHVLFIAFKIMKEEKVRLKLSSHAAFLAFAIMTQIFLGFGAFIYTRVFTSSLQSGTPEILIRTAHQTVGALILAASFTLTLRAFKFLKQSRIV